MVQLLALLGVGGFGLWLGYGWGFSNGGKWLIEQVEKFEREEAKKDA